MSYLAANTLVNTDADSMFREIDAAEKSREAALTNYDNLLRNAKATEDWPEALTFEFLSYMIPRIVQENPTAAVSSRVGSAELVREQAMQMMMEQAQMGMVDPMQAQQVLDEISKPAMDAMASQHGLKRWIEQEDFRAILDRHCDSFLKCWSVGMTWIEPMRSDPSRRWPQTCVLDPRRYMVDPLAKHYSERAWEGHHYDIPKPTLQAMSQRDEEGGWDAKMIEELTPVADDKRNVDRQEVRVYEMWVPGYAGDEWDSDDPAFNGAIFTFGGKKSDESNSGVRGIEIRKPRPAYVPPWGPYTVYGCYNRTGSAWPISPLLATYAQQNELQSHAKAMNVNARQYKRVVMVSDKNPTLAAQIARASDNLVIPVANEQFEKNQVASIELGGISDQQLKMYQQIKMTLQRTLGMDDQQSGRVDPNATATAVAVADEAVATRVSYIESKFIAAVRMNLRSVLHYMIVDERVSFRLGADLSEQLSMFDPWFIGGLADGEIYDPDDLELVIDPYSMGRVSEAALQQKVNQFIEMVMAMAPAMLQFPFIDWRKVIRSATQVLNLPELADAVDFNMVKQMGAMQMQMGMAQQAVEMDGSQAAADASRLKAQSNAEQLIQNRVGGGKRAKK